MALAWHSTESKSRTPIGRIGRNAGNPLAMPNESQIRNGGFLVESPASQTPNEYEQSAKPHRPNYRPDPVFDVLAVAGTAFGTLK